jgi:serine/threonine protein kinase
VGGRYRLEALLGAGGFGAVFRASDAQGQRRVAIKLLSRSARLQSDATARFYREARLAMTLRHPNTVRLLDFGDAGEGTPFIAFELLEGVSLEQRLANGALPVAEALAIALEVLGSLEEAHANQVIHRDVKPANVFLCRQPPGAIKLLDFGVAQEEPAGAVERLTREGTLVGTPGYMAPEQLAGRPAGPQTDLFALALVLAEMVEGRPVYQGEALRICLAKLNGEPVPFPASVPPALLPVLQRATAADVARRHRSAAEMRSALVATGLWTVHAGVPSISLPRPMSGTVPLAEAPRQPRPSALASTAPPSVASPFASTSVDRPRPAVRPHLAETVNDPDGSNTRAPAPLASTVAMNGAPRESPPIAPAPAPARRRSRTGPVAVVVVFILLGLAAWITLRVTRGA